MFTLVKDKSRFFRVKQGQSDREVELALNTPVSGVFGGAIIEAAEDFLVYVATPRDSYRSLSEMFGVSEDELRKINFGRPVYPTCRLFIPRKSGGVSI